jgi:hypothetical protein
MSYPPAAVHHSMAARPLSNIPSPRFTVHKGDWFRTNANNNGRCWLSAPSLNEEPLKGPNLGGVGTFIGPVHDVDISYRFIAIMVPHPYQRDLPVWVNVWTSQNQAGRPSHVDFCSPVQRMECINWRRQGWIDQYMEFADISMSAFAVQYRGWNVSTGGAEVG